MRNEVSLNTLHVHQVIFCCSSYKSALHWVVPPVHWWLQLLCIIFCNCHAWCWMPSQEVSYCLSSVPIEASGCLTLLKKNRFKKLPNRTKSRSCWLTELTPVPITVELSQHVYPYFNINTDINISILIFISIFLVGHRSTGSEGMQEVCCLIRKGRKDNVPLPKLWRDWLHFLARHSALSQFWASSKITRIRIYEKA